MLEEYKDVVLPTMLRGEPGMLYLFCAGCGLPIDVWASAIDVVVDEYYIPKFHINQTECYRCFTMNEF